MLVRQHHVSLAVNLWARVQYQRPGRFDADGRV